MESGVIKYINPIREYGFIAPAGKGEEVFFHSNQVVEPVFENLEKGNIVDYVKEETKRGYRAREVVAYPKQ